MRIILHGGFIEKATDGGAKFVETVLKPFEKHNEVKISLCLFARDPDTWRESANKEIEIFTKLYARENKLIFDLTAESDFLDDITKSNILIIKGGDTEMLLKIFSKYNKEEISESFKGKTIVGYSAGTYALSKYYLKVSAEGEMSIGKGLGIVPIKTVSHFKSDFYPNKFPNKFNWRSAEKLIREYKPNLDIALLQEGEFRVINEN